jgi:hypothetical protein
MPGMVWWWKKEQGQQPRFFRREETTTTSTSQWPHLLIQNSCSSWAPEKDLLNDPILPPDTDVIAFPPWNAIQGSIPFSAFIGIKHGYHYIQDVTKEVQHYKRCRVCLGLGTTHTSLLLLPLPKTNYIHSLARRRKLEPQSLISAHMVCLAQAYNSMIDCITSTLAHINPCEQTNVELQETIEELQQTIKELQQTSTEQTIKVLQQTIKTKEQDLTKSKQALQKHKEHITELETANTKQQQIIKDLRADLTNLTALVQKQIKPLYQAVNK